MKRNTDRLIKLMIEKVLIEKGTVEKEDTTYSENEELKEKDIFFNVIIPNLEAQLNGGKAYLCGYDFSLADIAFFNELMTTIELTGQNIEARKFPNVDKWLKRIEDIGPVRVATIKFQEEFKRLLEMLK